MCIFHDPQPKFEDCTMASLNSFAMRGLCCLGRVNNLVCQTFTVKSIHREWLKLGIRPTEIYKKARKVAQAKESPGKSWEFHSQAKTKSVAFG